MMDEQDDLLSDAIPSSSIRTFEAADLPNERTLPQLRPEVSGRFVIAIDYGTTFTGFASANTSSDRAELDDIAVLQEWTSSMSNQSQVPSIISYSNPSQDAVQWGSDFSDDAKTISRTKLELEPQPVLEELDMLFQVLKGTGCLGFKAIRDADENPPYTSKTPEEIISDYLVKIFGCASNELNLVGLHLTGIPIDLVLTVPVGWSYEAYGSYFRAVRAAGFNRDKLQTLQDTLMLTEAEAAAYFTARDLARQNGKEFLKNGDCFILCDAGGGTVDLVAFQVKQTQPHLELERATKPTGGRYGSSLIDNRFQEWLRTIVGKKLYAKKLDPDSASSKRISPHATETGPMRDVMKKFNTAKADFKNSKDTPDIKLDLSKSLGPVNIPERMIEGELTIRREEMRKLMDPCVTGVLKLIQHQLEMVSSEKKRRVRDIILVGGFGASPYLRDRLENTPTIKQQRIGLRRPDSALTAVVQGAVIYGIEKESHQHAHYMFGIMRSYGIKIRNNGKEQFEWLIRKGDLALSNSDTKIESRSFNVVVRDCINGKTSLTLYAYCARDENDDNLPTLFGNGYHEVERLCTATCDFTGFLDRDLRPRPDSLTPGKAGPPRSAGEIGPLRWQLKITPERINGTVLLKEVPVGYCTARLETDGADDSDE